MSLFRLAAACGAGAALLSAVALRSHAESIGGEAPSRAAARGQSTATPASLPGPRPRQLVFVPAPAGADPSVRFVGAGLPTPVQVMDDGFVLGLQRLGSAESREVAGASVAFRFSGRAARFESVGAVAAPVHLLRGRDGLRSSGSADCSSIRMVDCAAGVDVVLRDDPDDSGRGALAYDLWARNVVALAGFTIRVEGARALRADSDGGISIDVELGDGTGVELTQRPPETFVIRGGAPVRIASRAVLRGSMEFGFEVVGAGEQERLCVDPGFLWSTYLGGGASDEAHCVRRLADGDLLIGGWAGSLDFPTTPGTYRATGGRDAFLACISADGSTLRWSTYLGGRDAEEIDCIDVAADGTIVVGGWTGSADFPITAGAFQRFFFGGGLLANIGDGFVAGLRADGSALVWSTYLGRFGDDFVRRLAVDRDGTVVVAGDTTSDSFPTTPGVIQADFRSGNVFLPDGFVSRLSADGRSLIWSTFFGGFAQDYVSGMRLTESGSIVFGGLTASIGLPFTAGAYQSTVRGFWDGYVTRISSDATHVEACTLLGGEGFDQINDLVVDQSGDVICVGRVGGDLANFPVTPGAFQIAPGGENDAFVARISADATTLRSATLLGGGGDDDALGVTLLPDGTVVVVGSTAGDGFPIGGGAAQTLYGGGVSDGFVARLDPSLATARAVSFAGGSAKDTLRSVTATGLGDECVAVGSTFSTDLPVPTNALQPGNRGDSDAVVLRIDVRNDTTAILALDGPLVSRGEQSFAAGAAIDALAFRLRNQTGTTIELESIDVTLGGTGDVRDQVLGLSVWLDSDQDGRLSAGDLRLGATSPALHEADRIRLACPRRLAPAESVPLVVRMDTAPGCPLRAELVAALDLALAVSARRVDDGRRVSMGGLGALAGSARICDSRQVFGGDVDRNGSVDVRDTRRLVARLGEAPVDLGEDPSGDGVIDASDVQMQIARVLSRAPVGVTPSSVTAGGVLALPGYDLQGAPLSCAIDGVLLGRITATPRVQLFAVPAATSRGAHTITATADGIVWLRAAIEVR